MDKKKVLIISYYWPPSGGPGVQRVLKFAKYLNNLGWEPVILTVKDGEYPAIDPSMEKDIPANCKVYKTKTIEFFSLFKKLTGRKKDAKIETYILNRKEVSFKDKVFRWIRQNIFVPDARVGWVPFAIREGKKIIKIEKPDLIFSSSPPHSLHLSARKLAKWGNLPWIADFRDPWSDAFWDKHVKRTRWANKKNKRLEYEVLQSANGITTVSQYFLFLLREKFANPNYRIIANGYDASDFQAKKSVNSKLTIVYAGNMAESQNPKNFFEALANLPEEQRQKIQVDFYGKQDHSALLAMQEYGVTDFIQRHGYVDHNQATAAMMNADILLLLIPKQHARGMITGKVYEYIATKNYILGIGDPEGDAGKFVDECKIGHMYDYEVDLKTTLQDLLHKWENKIALNEPDTKLIQQYSREELSKALAAFFNETSMLFINPKITKGKD